MRNLRIAYVGNFTQSHCTEVHLAATLEDMGHEVIRIQENDPQPDWLEQSCAADLFLFTRTWGNLLTLDHLHKIEANAAPTASYHLDLYVGLKRERGLDNDPFWRTQFVFTPDGAESSASVFEAKGINHHYMKPGVYRDECYMGAARPDQMKDVLFVGGGEPTGGLQYGHPEWSYRGQLLAFLRDNYGDRFHKFGHPQETIRNDRLNQLYADAKVVVGDSLCLNFDHPHYWSDRVYETLGRGGFIIHPYIKGMEEEFTDGETIVFYTFNDWDGLKKKIDYYLENHAEREAIRLRGHQFVKENCTYHQRLQQMLDVIYAGN